MLDEVQNCLSGEAIDVVRLMCIKDVLRCICVWVIAAWQHFPLWDALRVNTIIWQRECWSVVITINNKIIMNNWKSERVLRKTIQINGMDCFLFAIYWLIDLFNIHHSILNTLIWFYASMYRMNVSCRGLSFIYTGIWAIREYGVLIGEIIISNSEYNIAHGMWAVTKVGNCLVSIKLWENGKWENSKWAKWITLHDSHTACMFWF